MSHSETYGNETTFADAPAQQEHDMHGCEGVILTLHPATDHANESHTIHHVAAARQPFRTAQSEWLVIDSCSPRLFIYYIKYAWASIPLAEGIMGISE